MQDITTPNHKEQVLSKLLAATLVYEQAGPVNAEAWSTYRELWDKAYALCDEDGVFDEFESISRVVWNLKD